MLVRGKDLSGVSNARDNSHNFCITYFLNQNALNSFEVYFSSPEMSTPTPKSRKSGYLLPASSGPQSIILLPTSA